MKTLLKFILIALFCISTIKNACTGTTVTKSACEQDTICKWTEQVPGVCSGGDAACIGPSSSSQCTSANETCSWADAIGTSTDKTCADYTSETPCNAMATCQWGNGACST